MKTGLVLEGGGLRGLFTAGVLDVMMERDIKVDGIVGVSAGACFGCNYVSKQPGRILRYNVNMTKEPRYMGLRPLLRTGNLMDPEFAYHTLPDEIDIFDKDTFNKSSVEYHVVCTDVLTGEPVYKHLTPPVDYDFMEWLRASSALPLVSIPVELEGRQLLDGGMSDSIPLKYFQNLGYEHNIVILTQPKGFTKKRTKLMPLFHTLMRKYPAVIDVMNRRHIMYNAQLEYLAQEEKAGRITVIAPDDTLPIGRTEQNVEKMKRVYQMGREAAEKLF
ncbi:MAG: patatin family protein [Bacteroidaceae bacterium]|nr:patatin family protein [Bacteroidaceae bacterium]